MRVLASAWGTAGEHVSVADFLRRLVLHGHEVHVLASEAHRKLHTAPDRHFHALRSVRMEDYGNLRLQVSGELVKHLIDPLATEQFVIASELIRRHAIDLVLASWITPGVIAAGEAEGTRVLPLYLYPLAAMPDGDLPVFTRWPRLTAKYRYPASGRVVRQAILRYFRKLSPNLLALRKSMGLIDDGGLLPGAGGPGLALFPSRMVRVPLAHVFVPADPLPSAQLPASVLNFVSRGSPPVLVFLGSLAAGRRDVVVRIISALARIGERSIVVWGSSSSEHLATDTVLELGEFPIATLLPHVKAVVHHGGINTIAATLAAAKPALVVPWLGDQLDNAYRLADLGAGLFLKPTRTSDAALVAALEVLVGAELADAAKAIGSALEQERTGNLPFGVLELVEKGGHCCQ